MYLLFDFIKLFVKNNYCLRAPMFMVIISVRLFQRSVILYDIIVNRGHVGIESNQPYTFSLGIKHNATEPIVT